MNTTSVATLNNDIYVGGVFNEALNIFMPFAGSTTLFSDGGISGFGIHLNSGLEKEAAFQNDLPIFAASLTLAVDSEGNVFVGGNGFGNAQFSPLAQLELFNDAYLAKWGCNPVAPAVSSNGSTTFCEGGSVQLIGPEPEEVAGYQWLKDGQFISEATASTFTATETGIYKVQLTAVSGCVSISPNVLVLSIQINQPTISQNGNTLTALLEGGGLVSYQWFKDGLLINGATNSTLTVNNNGTYTVQVTNNNGCTAISEPLYFSTDGKNWLFATDGGGAGTDVANAVATGNNAVFVTGYFEGTATFGGFSLTSAGGKDVFVLKQNKNNGNVIWAARAGGSGDDEGKGLSVDANGNVCVIGSFAGTANFGLVSKTSNGGKDIFLTRLKGTDGTFQGVRAIGGNGFDSGNAVATDAQNNIYFAGEFSNTATFGTTNLTSAGGTDVFVTKLSSSGAFIWTAKGGGMGLDAAKGIALNNNHLFLTGSIGAR